MRVNFSRGRTIDTGERGKHRWNKVLVRRGSSP